MEVNIKTPAQERADLLYPEDFAEETPPEGAGEPQEVETPEAEREEPEPESEGDTPPDAASDDSETPDDEESAEEASEEPEVKAEEPEDDDEYMKSVEELAEHLETDPDFIESLTVQQKINGKMVDVSIADALATHRKVSAADDVLADAKAKRNDILTEATEERTKVGEQVAMAAALLQELETEADKAIGVDMERLRVDDPQEWTAKKQEQRERQERLAKAKEKVQTLYRDAIDEQNRRIQEQRVKQLPAEQEILIERVPEWKDEAKASQERKEVLKYMHDQGFSESEVSVAGFSGKALALAIKAMRYDQLQGKRTQLKKKRQTKIPKSVKPGTKSEDSKPKPPPTDRASLLYG